MDSLEKEAGEKSHQGVFGKESSLAFLSWHLRMSGEQLQ